MSGKGLPWKPDLILSSIGQNPCGLLAGNRDRDRRPCEGIPNASATRPVASAQTASRHSRGAVARWTGSSSTGPRVFAPRGNENPRAQVCATNCAIRHGRLARPPNGCAIISCRLGHRAAFCFLFSEAEPSKPMMAADRTTLLLRVILVLFILGGLPSAASSLTLEDSAKELARKISAALPAEKSLSCEIHNISSLKPEETARVEQALKTELQEQGIRLTTSGAATSVMVTLSENFESLVWTGEIRQGDVSQVVLMVVERSLENRAFSTGMPVTINSEKFWEGPERILDAGEISEGDGKSWLVLLLPDGVQIQDRQTGSSSSLEISSNQSAARDPWGNLNFDPIGHTITFFLAPRVCTVNLESPNLDGCLSGEGSSEVPLAGNSRVIFDIAPAGPPPPGKGTEIEIKSVCGNADQFLATGARDYTQTDSLQLFQMESIGAVAVSSESDFPGPITALHAVSVTPRAIVRNLTTRNYEAYDLSFSCAQ